MIKNLFVENEIKIDLFDFFKNFKKNITKYKNDEIYFLIDTKKYRQFQKNKKTQKLNSL